MKTAERRLDEPVLDATFRWAGPRHLVHGHINWARRSSLDGSVVEWHDPRGRHTGVSTDCHGDARVIINATLFVDNGDGLVMHGTERRVAISGFQKHAGVQMGVSGHRTSISVTKTLFDDRVDTTPDGIVANRLAWWLIGYPLAVQECDIVNHSQAGARNNEKRGFDASGNW